MASMGWALIHAMALACCLTFGRVVGVSDYVSEDKFPLFPFHQHIQVRKTITVEHLPSAYSHSAAQGTQHDAVHSASNAPSSAHPQRLRQEVMTERKAEVYEEKGYTDSAYDQESSLAAESQGRPKNALHSALHGSGPATPILNYAASVLYDKAAHERGIYRARAGGPACPQINNFHLKGTTRVRESGGRVTGLGARMDCLRRKYLGAEPLPSAIFLPPAQSRHTPITMGTFQDFLKETKRLV